MSDNNFEQRCAIKFCFRLGHNATETFAKLQQAYGDSVLLRAQVFRWFKAFSEGSESIEDEPHSGRPSVSKTCAFLWDLVRSDRRLTVRKIGEELNLNHTTVHQISTNELKMRKICAKMVPKTFLSEPFLGQRKRGAVTNPRQTKKVHPIEVWKLGEEIVDERGTSGLIHSPQSHIRKSLMWDITFGGTSQSVEWHAGYWLLRRYPGGVT
ncbi:protein GVQW3 [Trichonephila clavipes]|nr:protein GVQW3 [Trichonephila clavipes]